METTSKWLAEREQQTAHKSNGGFHRPYKTSFWASIVGEQSNNVFLVPHLLLSHFFFFIFLVSLLFFRLERNNNNTQRQTRIPLLVFLLFSSSAVCAQYNFRVFEISSTRSMEQAKKQEVEWQAERSSESAAKLDFSGLFRVLYFSVLRRQRSFSDMKSHYTIFGRVCDHPTKALIAFDDHDMAAKRISWNFQWIHSTGPRPKADAWKIGICR